jgi:hypothetical protein
MELKQNDRGIYLFFPTDAKGIQCSDDELRKLRMVTQESWTWDINRTISEACNIASEIMKSGDNK